MGKLISEISAYVEDEGYVLTSLGACHASASKTHLDSLQPLAIKFFTSKMAQSTPSTAGKSGPLVLWEWSVGKDSQRKYTNHVSSYQGVYWKCGLGAMLWDVPFKVRRKLYEGIAQGEIIRLRCSVLAAYAVVMFLLPSSSHADDIYLLMPLSLCISCPCLKCPALLTISSPPL